MVNIFSYKDFRSLDGPITIGFPLVFYLDNSYGKFCSNPENSLLCDYPRISYINLLTDIVLIYITSIILTYLYTKLKKNN